MKSLIRKNFYSFFILLMLMTSCGESDDTIVEGPLVQTIQISGVTFKGDDAVSVGVNGDIYVSSLISSSGTEIYKVSNNGSSSVFTSLNAPMGHDLDQDGNLFVSQNNSNSIVKITPQGAPSSYVTDDRFSGGSLTIDEDGTIYHTVFSTNSVYKISPQKEVVLIASGGDLNVPFGITLDDDKNVYVANFSNGIINKITPAGEITKLATITSRVGYIKYANNQIYATGFSSNKIYLIALDGSVTTLAGTGLFGDNDGPALEATFVSPNGIDVSEDGKTLYISQKDFKIRTILLNN